MEDWCLFELLHNHLGNKNQLFFSSSEKDVPMIYPFLTDNIYLREKLINLRVYIPRYWADVERRCNSNDIELYLANHVLPLPIDQRYGMSEMLYMINIIKKEL